MQPLMTFNDFLNALMRLSVQLYEAPSVDASFEALLMENVLPFAKRRVGCWGREPASDGTGFLFPPASETNLLRLNRLPTRSNLTSATPGLSSSKSTFSSACTTSSPFTRPLQTKSGAATLRAWPRKSS